MYDSTSRTWLSYHTKDLYLERVRIRDHTEEGKLPKKLPFVFFSQENGLGCVVIVRESLSHSQVA
jgi:hypothetical protein